MGKKNIVKGFDRLTMKDKLGYALGDTGGVLAFGIVGSFLQMYYTDVLHISLGKIAVLMLISRVWDAINDPIWGNFIDSRKPTKYGRFRPYILWSSFPLAISFILMFIKIPGLSENQYLIYAYITYIFYGMMYTGANIPYGSLASAMTEDSVERSSLSVARSFGAGIGSMPGQILLPLFVYSTAIDTGVKYLDSNKFFSAVVLIAGFILIIYFASFKMTRERISVPEYQEKANFRKTMRVLLRNRPFIALSLASMLLIAVSMYTQTIYNYLLKNYYNQPQLFSLVTVANYLPMLALMPFMGKFVKRFGKKEICGFGGLLAAATNIILFFMRTPNPYVFLGFCVLSGIGITFFTLEIWALVGDVIDYQELLSKRREEGTSYACFSFTRKIGQTIAGMGSSVALAFIGYNTGENAIIQTNEVIHGMYSIATLVPAAMYLGIFLILTFLYPLSKNKIVTVIDQLKMSRMKVG